MSGVIEANIPGHGVHRINARDLDLTIERLLPASMAVLSSYYEEISGSSVAKGELNLTELLVLIAAQVFGEVPGHDEPVSHYEVAQITWLHYELEPDIGGESHEWVFKEGSGFNHDGQAVKIRPPSSCRRLPTVRPVRHLIERWPGIKDRVLGNYVFPVVQLGGEDGE